MAYPIDPSEGYVRTPGKYIHDAFGHDGSDGCKRVRPHTGIDTAPTVANARNRAVVAGVVTRTGFSVYTGNYVEIRDTKGRYWLTFHQRQNLVSAGQSVAEGAVIGYTGDTGGSGALGADKIAVHNHTSLCATQAAATRLITGQVRARYKNETTAQWAADRGLLDPWPIIRDGEKADAPATGGTTKEPATPRRRSPNMLLVGINSNGHPENGRVYLVAPGKAPKWIETPQYLDLLLNTFETNHGYRPTVRNMSANEAYRVFDLVANS